MLLARSPPTRLRLRILRPSTVVIQALSGPVWTARLRPSGANAAAHTGWNPATRLVAPEVRSSTARSMIGRPPENELSARPSPGAGAGTAYATYRPSGD